jgi:hypothetical protein
LLGYRPERARLTLADTPQKRGHGVIVEIRQHGIIDGIAVIAWLSSVGPEQPDLVLGQFPVAVPATDE